MSLNYPLSSLLLLAIQAVLVLGSLLWCGTQVVDCPHPQIIFIILIVLALEWRRARAHEFSAREGYKTLPVLLNLEL